MTSSRLAQRLAPGSSNPWCSKWFTAAMLLGLLAAGPAGAEEPAAVLAVVAGDVTIVRGEQTLDGSFGASLQAGDVVTTGAEAQAAVLFESGQIIELGPGSHISIGSLPARGGDEPVLAQVPDAFAGSLNRFAHASSGEEGLAALPNLRSGGGDGEPEPFTPRNTLIEPHETTFRWAPVEDVLEYRVTLSGPGELAGDHRAGEESWTPSGHAFEPGEQWSWKVEAVTPDGPVASEEVGFEVAGEEQLAELAGLREKFQPLLESEDPTRIDTATYLLGTYCRSAGFYGQAIAHLESLVARHPDRKELHEELGSLYQAVGRNDKAAEEYRIALKE